MYKRQVLDSDLITRAQGIGGDVDLASIDGDMAVGHHLAGSITGIGEAEPINDVVETGLEKLEEGLAGDTAASEGDLEVPAELALKEAVLITELLLLGKGDGVF